MKSNPGSEGRAVSLIFEGIPGNKSVIVNLRYVGKICNTSYRETLESAMWVSSVQTESLMYQC